MPRVYRRRRYNPRINVKRHPSRAQRKPGMTIKKAVKYASYIPSIIKTVQAVKGLVNSEFKDYGTVATPTADDSGSVTALTAIGQGDTSNTRDGDSILMQSLTYRATCHIHTSQTNHSTVRYIIFQTVDDDVPTVSTVLANVGAGPTPLSLMNLDNAHHYRILEDRVLQLQDGIREQISWKKYFKLNTHVKWDDATATNYKSGHFWLLVISDDATNVPTFSFNYRFRYTDN